MRRAAETSSGFDKGVEHGLQVEGRPADDFEDSAVAVCCCNSVKSSVRWRSSFSRRVFSMAITA